MFLSYSSFKNDIKLFNYEEYNNIEDFSDNICSLDNITSVQRLSGEISPDFRKLQQPSVSQAAPHPGQALLGAAENVSEQTLKSTILSFFDFIKYYKDIENEDFKKPIFSQTSKFKKTPGNYKNYKYVKINRDNEEINKDAKEKKEQKEFKKAWHIENSTDENTKILITIKTFLNKISEETYKKISNDFINELIKINNENLFEILCKEILNKCLYDNKYRNLYINLCFKVWSNRDIHYNLVKINNDNNLFYWDYKNNIYGPFNTENEAKINIYEKLNFKRYFLNYIQNLYNNKDLNLENLSEEDFFIKKKNILLIPELITIMYLEKHICFDIINLLIIDLLDLDNSINKYIQEIEIEIIYNLIKLLKEQKAGKLHEYKLIFGEFINIINNEILKENISKRSNFFLTDIISMLELLSNNNIKNSNGFIKINNEEDNGTQKNLFGCGPVRFIESCRSDEGTNDSNINKFLEYLKNNNTKELIYIYSKKNNINTKKLMINKFINYFIEQRLPVGLGYRKTGGMEISSIPDAEPLDLPKVVGACERLHKNNNLDIINFLLTIEKNDSELIYEILESNVNNIEDILIDVPYANKKIIYIIENLNLNNDKKELFLNVLNNIKDDDSEYSGSQ